MSRAWRRCWPGCRRRCPASPSTGCAARAWRRSPGGARRSRPATARLQSRAASRSMTRAPLVMAKPRGVARRRANCELRHHARLALHQPPHGGAVPALSAWARRPRTWPRQCDISRADRMLRAGEPACARRPQRAGGSPTSSSPVPVPRARASTVSRQTRRAPAPGHDAREAGAAAPAFREGRQRDGRQRQRHQRRRGGAAGDVGASRPTALGLTPLARDRRHGGRRRRPVVHGHRAGAGHAQGAGARRPVGRRPRSDRAERGLCGPGAGRACASWGSTPRG